MIRPSASGSVACANALTNQWGLMDTVVDIAIAKEGKEALAERWLGVNYILEISTNAPSAIAIALVLWIS